MPETIQPVAPTIYLAPLQGFTDWVYRKAYNEVFREVDAFFIPYISVKNNQVLKKYENEILSVNNPQNRVIPQVLAGNADEMLFLSGYLEEKGYSEINLNLGCPYPMVTNREMGAGLLPHPEKIQDILTSFFEKSSLRLSVKLRAGLLSQHEIEKVIPVLNKFPLTEIIFHPRIAKQLYDGDVFFSAFEFAAKHIEKRLVYNGNIFTVQDYNNYFDSFPGIDTLMLGRGVLMNPFLPAELKGMNYHRYEKMDMLKGFHQRIFELYSEKMDNDGNVLNKMKQFWIYFSYNFTDQRKSLKMIKKAGNLEKFKNAVKIIFQNIS